MKQGWEKQYFENCFKLKSGDNLTAKNMSENGNYPVFGGNGIAGYHNEFNLSGSNVIIGRVGALCGNVRHLTENIWLTDNAFRIVDFKFDFDHSFLTYLLNYKDLRSYARQAAQPVISNSSLKDVVLQFPKSLPEQQRIVSILDRAFTSIDKAKANAEQNLQNAKELFESYLQGVFENGNWEEKSLSEVCEISSKLIDPKKSKFQNLTHVGAGNIEIKTGRLSDLKTAKEENLISGKFLFDESMVLYSKIRPYLMKVVNCEFEGLCSADIYPLKPFEKVIRKDYLYHLLLSKEFTDYAIMGSQRAGMPKVNRKHLFAYRFKLPPIKEQQTIVRQLDALQAETQKLEAVYQKKMDDLEELKKSILQKAFAGELTQTKHYAIHDETLTLAAEPESIIQKQNG
ncbi:MAG: restriction endonuclease subunit S [Cyclobacteriaceae bacterium]|nr:restriction endonuclease subunit S [Cyclobacteriaceae bacterium]